MGISSYDDPEPSKQEEADMMLDVETVILHEYLLEDGKLSFL
ncbi:hypothetical protein ACQKL0_08905 [Peribacillus sp. NPDC097264]